MPFGAITINGTPIPLTPAEAETLVESVSASWVRLLFAMLDETRLKILKRAVKVGRPPSPEPPPSSVLPLILKALRK
jgi:hypothetical protein